MIRAPRLTAGLRARGLAVLAAIAALSFNGFACSSAAPNTDRAGNALVIGPYVGSVDSDRFSVLWETSADVPTRLRWGAQRDCPSLLGNAELVTRHEVVVTGLLPGTVYWYRLDDAGQAGEAIPVRTQPDALRSVRVAVVGDTHSTDGVHARILREILAEHPDLLIHTGDLSLRPGKKEGGTDRDFFRVEAPLLRSVPILPVLGNHDGGGFRFVDLFVRPRGGGEEPFYLARWGPLAFIALDTNQAIDAKSDQGRWLARTLETLAKDDGVVFRVVGMHWGPFDSGSGHGSNVEARDALVPLFEKFGVDVVFSGHDHVYERGTVAGVRYVMTGGGGGSGRKPHEVLGGAWTEASATAPHHGLLEIDGRSLRFTAREARTGRILDEFHVDKETARPAPGLPAVPPPRG